MLRVTEGDDNIEVRFDHKILDPSDIEGLTGICVEESRRCSMVAVDLNGKKVGRGISICNPVDNFCKSIGRKIALADGLCCLNKNLRTAIWKAYWEMCGF